MFFFNVDAYAAGTLLGIFKKLLRGFIGNIVFSRWDIAIAAMDGDFSAFVRFGGNNIKKADGLHEHKKLMKTVVHCSQNVKHEIDFCKGFDFDFHRCSFHRCAENLI